MPKSQGPLRGYLKFIKPNPGLHAQIFAAPIFFFLARYIVAWVVIIPEEAPLIIAGSLLGLYK